MEKIWLSHYQPGVPAEINPDIYSNLIDMFDRSCEKYRDNAAFINFGSSISYAELEKMTLHIAAYLQNKLGLKKGDRIAIMLPNVLQFPVIMFGALRAGLTIVNINPLYTKDELIHQINDAQCKTIIVLANFAHTVEAALPHTSLKNIIVTQLGDLFNPMKGMIYNCILKYVKKVVQPYHFSKTLFFKDMLTEGKKLKFIPPVITHDDIAFLQYTGGTTGVPKGAQLTHRNLLANIEQLSAWIKSSVHEGQELVISALPLYHIFALMGNTLVFIKFGATNLLITNPRDIPHFIKELRRYPFSVVIGVNTLFNALMNAPGFAKLDFSHLRFSFGGGMAIHETVAKRWKKITGGTLIEGYGLTEASPVISANPMNISAYTASIGLPLPSTEISLRDKEGKEVLLGEVGELCVRGPQVMGAYWNQPEETKKAFTHDGWLRTGDLVKIDNHGYLEVVDRIKDMILVSGFNVYPNEVEGVIAAHPGVAEVGVIGVEDEYSGEVVEAVIVKKDPKLTEKQILDHCYKYLTAYKVPKRILFTSELPKSNVGKILRKELRNGPCHAVKY